MENGKVSGGIVKIPSEINVLGARFRIEIVTQAVLRGRREKDPDMELCGDMCPIERRIRILKTLSEEMKMSTLIHECVHAIFAISGQNERLEDIEEESLTVALECGILGILPVLSEVLASMEKS